MSLPTASSYGADAFGLICGFCVDADGQNATIGADDAMAWLARTNAQAGFVWLHFNLAHAATEKWLHRHLASADVFLESLRDGSRSTRVELDGETLVAVVNDVHYDFAFDPADISTLWLTVGPRLMVSARLQPLRSIDRLRDAMRKGLRVKSTVELLVHLMHDQEDARWRRSRARSG